MPQPQRDNKGGDEFFYVDADGKKCDAELHNAILDEGDHEAAKQVSDKIKDRVLAKRKANKSFQTRAREESELTEVELWPEEGEKRSEFMDRCTDELEKCIGDRAEEVCGEKWHQSRKLGKKGFVTVRLTGDLAIEPCGKTCVGCKGAAKAGTKRLDSPDLLNPSNGLHKGHGYDHDDRERRRAREIAERPDTARARDRRGRDGAASEADGAGSHRSLQSWRDVDRAFDPSQPRDEQGRWADTGASYESKNPSAAQQRENVADVYKLDRDGQNAALKAGITPLTFHRLTSKGSDQFHAAIMAAKGGKFGASVHAYGADEYRDMRIFLTPDGNVGFALKPNGDCVSAFKNESVSDIAGAAESALTLAVQHGGTRLDAFDTVLPRIYSNSGFHAVARLAWSDEFAPEGWDKATYAKFNNGEPDVVFMVYDPDHKERYKPGEGKRVTTYDEGVAAQDEAIKALKVPKK